MLKKAGVTLACTYGQTELAGPVMFGEINGDPDCLLPFHGVKWELRTKPGDESGSGGELCLLGNGSSTAGYCQLASDPRKYRDLSGGTSDTTTRFCTGDRFKKELINGATWLRYICRDDDLLVHTSGEMSNPLPIEQQMAAACPDLVSKVACVGTGMPRPMMVLELHKGVDASNTDTVGALKAGVQLANVGQPSYSHVLTQHVMILTPSQHMPVTVKGNVQRFKVEEGYKSQLQQLRSGDSSGLQTLKDPNGDDDDGGAAVYDSLATTTTKSKGKGGAKWDHLIGMRVPIVMMIYLIHSMPYGRGREAAVTSENTSTYMIKLSHSGLLYVDFFICLSAFGVAQKAAPALGAIKFNLRAFLTWLRSFITQWGRLYLTAYLGMAIDLAFNPDYPQGKTRPLAADNLVSCLTLINGWFFIGTCPDFPVWFCSILMPCFLFYSLLGYRALNWADKRAKSLPGGGSIGIVLAGLIGWALPIIFIFLGEQASDDKGFNLHRTYNGLNSWDGSYNFSFARFFPPAWWGDFLLGASVGLVVKRQGTAGKWEKLLRGAVADAAALGILAYTFFHADPKPAMPDLKGGTMIMAHCWTPLHALFIWGSTASDDGSGLFAKFFSHPSFTSLGGYALEFYLLSVPLLTLWEERIFSSDGYYTSLLSVIAFWIFSALSSIMLVGPIVTGALKLFPTEIGPSKASSSAGL